MLFRSDDLAGGRVVDVEVEVVEPDDIVAAGRSKAARSRYRQ